jgi:hypothetical protein
MEVKPLKWFVYLILTAAMPACKQKEMPVCIASNEAPSPAVALSWYQLELKLIKESNRLSQPVAARVVACTGIVWHEAAVWGMSGVPALSGRLNGLHALPRPESGKQYNWAIVANSAMACITHHLFGDAGNETRNQIIQLERDNLDALSGGCAQDVMLRSVCFGRQMAGAIYQWSGAGDEEDGYLRYFPAGHAFLWVPGFVRRSAL